MYSILEIIGSFFLVTFVLSRTRYVLFLWWTLRGVPALTSLVPGSTIVSFSCQDNPTFQDWVACGGQSPRFGWNHQLKLINTT